MSRSSRARGRPGPVSRDRGSIIRALRVCARRRAARLADQLDQARHVLRRGDDQEVVGGIRAPASGRRCRSPCRRSSRCRLPAGRCAGCRAPWGRSPWRRPPGSALSIAPESLPHAWRMRSLPMSRWMRSSAARKALSRLGLARGALGVEPGVGLLPVGQGDGGKRPVLLHQADGVEQGARGSMPRNSLSILAISSEAARICSASSAPDHDGDGAQQGQFSGQAQIGRKRYVNENWTGFSDKLARHRVAFGCDLRGERTRSPVWFCRKLLNRGVCRTNAACEPARPPRRR